MLINVLLRLVAFLIIFISVVPKAYREFRMDKYKELSPIPFYLLILWLLIEVFIISSILLLWFGITSLWYFDSLIMFGGSIVLSLLYRGDNTLIKEINEKS